MKKSDKMMARYIFGCATQGLAMSATAVLMLANVKNASKLLTKVAWALYGTAVVAGQCYVANKFIDVGADEIATQYIEENYSDNSEDYED